MSWLQRHPTAMMLAVVATVLTTWLFIAATIRIDQQGRDDLAERNCHALNAVRAEAADVVQAAAREHLLKSNTATYVVALRLSRPLYCG